MATGAGEADPPKDPPEADDGRGGGQGGATVAALDPAGAVAAPAALAQGGGAIRRSCKFLNKISQVPLI